MLTATATMEGRTCQVIVESDLEANFSVVVYSGQVDSVSLIPRKASPLLVKVNAKSPWLALETVLRSLKERGRIQSYEIPLRPQAELDAEAAEKAANDAKKAGAKAAAATEEESDA